MKDPWQQPGGKGWFWGAAGSAAIHAGLAATLFLMPAEAREKLLGAVDFQVERKAAEEKQQEARTDPPPPPPPEEARVKVAKPKAEKPAEPEAPPKPPPPKFQMSGNTFASDGSWSLSAEVGDGRFGALDGVGKYEPGKAGDADGPSASSSGAASKEPAKPKKTFTGEIKDKPKVLLEQKIPYPAEARALGIEGKVRLRVTIDAKGKVVKVDVLEDPGSGLGQAAAKALAGFLFTPALDTAGNAVEYKITYTYEFKLE